MEEIGNVSDDEVFEDPATMSTGQQEVQLQELL